MSLVDLARAYLIEGLPELLAGGERLRFGRCPLIAMQLLMLPHLTRHWYHRKLEVAQRMAGHSNAKTTGYDRRNDDISLSEDERIGI